MNHPLWALNGPESGVLAATFLLTTCCKTETKIFKTDARFTGYKDVDCKNSLGVFHIADSWADEDDSFSMDS